MKLRIFISALLIAGGGFASSAIAAPVGATSAEAVTLNASVQSAVRIVLNSGATINLGTYTPLGGDLQGTLSFCVFSNTTGNGYDIKADSSTGVGSFDLTGPSAVSYTVGFDDAGTFAAAAATLSDDTFTAGTYAGGTDANCGTDNASIQVTVAETGNLDSALPGAYTDTLTLTVTPM